MPEHLLDADGIRRHLREVAAELPAESRFEVVLVGGALMALHGLRDSTVDVDSVRSINARLRAAVAVVAERHGLSSRWLNDSSRPFVPETLDVARCDVVLDLPGLRVLGAPLREVFVMKVYAARTRDVADLPLLWKVWGYTDVAEAVEHFRRAYPDEPGDPYLESWLRSVVGG